MVKQLARNHVKNLARSGYQRRAALAVVVLLLLAFLVSACDSDADLDVVPILPDEPTVEIEPTPAIEPTAEPDPTPEIVETAAVEPTALPEVSAVLYSQSDLFPFPDVSPTTGHSTLIRLDDAVEVTLHAAGLPVGDTVTLWWVIFNNPEHCTAGEPELTECGEADLFNEDVQGSVMYAHGQVIGSEGIGNFAARRSVGDITGDVFGGPGLLNPQGAEIHLAIRSHGTVIPALVSDQISTFNGGCEPPEWWEEAETPEHWGAPGPNTCYDLHFAVHLPSLAVAGDDLVRSTSDLLPFPDVAAVTGSSTLERHPEGVSMTLDVASLPAGDTVTIWWVIFNYPEYCSEGEPDLTACGDPDLFNEDVQASLMYATGQVVPAGGPIYFAAYRAVGDVSGDVFGGPGLLNPQGAEIHLAIRSHGVVIDDLVETQISTFNGGCEPPEWWEEAETPEHWGAPGPNTCTDLHFVVHLP